MQEDHQSEPQQAPARSLEDQLRQLPQPEVPEGLEAKLLAAIPAGIPQATPRRRSLRRRIVWACGAAAAAALILGVLLSTPWRRGRTGRPIATLSNDTSPRYVLGNGSIPRFEETRPCDILPPLSDWH